MNPQVSSLIEARRAILVVGTLDPLLSDSELFHAALQKAGVAAGLHVFEDGPHAFLQMFTLDLAGDAIARLSAFGRRRPAS
jgi:acetyl esterase/lipase